MGRDKALIEWLGKPLIRHVLDAVTPLVTDVFIVADNAETYATFGVPVISDIYKGTGPLGGLHAALTHAAARDVFVCACDMPGISTAFVEKLLARWNSMAGDDADAIVVVAGGRTHPLFGIYSPRLLPRIDASLREGRCALQSFLVEIGAELFPIPDDRPFFNVNTPEEFEALPDSYS